MSGRDIHTGWRKSADEVRCRLRLSGFGPRPFGTQFAREVRDTYTITEFSQCLSQEPSQPKPLGRGLDLSQGSRDLEGIDRGGSDTGITVNSMPDCRQTGCDGFDLVQIALTDFDCGGGLFDELQCLDYEAGGTTARPKH